MSQDLVLPADKKLAVIAYRLDPIRPLWVDAQAWHRNINIYKGKLDEFKAGLAEISHGANSFTLDGETVASMVPGQFNESKMAQELPDLHEEYMRMITKRQFDRAGFRKDHPQLYEQYRAQRFCFTGE